MNVSIFFQKAEEILAGIANTAAQKLPYSGRWKTVKLNPKQYSFCLYTVYILAQKLLIIVL